MGMTKEEKIRGLYNLKEYLVKNPIELDRHKSLPITLIDYAIESLEQQPCDDCISRAELLARIDAERKHLLDLKMDGAEHIIVHHARRIIEDMPSVMPQVRWIPVSERLPQYGKEVLTCDSEGFIAIQSIECNVWDEYDYWENQNGDRSDIDEVIVWMPLPEPYKESEE